MPRRLKGMPYRGKSASRQLLAKELERARRKRTIADQAVRRLERLWNSQRPWHECKRCGHSWQGVDPDRQPRCCAQCHSAGWATASKSARARKPTDEANPNWGRKGGPKRKTVVFDPPPAPEPTPPKFEHILMEATVTVPSTDEVAQVVLEDLRRAVALPAGLPPPPSFVSADVELIRPAPLLSPMTQMPSPPVLWQPKQEIEPQPETFSRPPVATAPAPEPDEPDWEAILPKLPVDTILMADAAETAWEDYAE